MLIDKTVWKCNTSKFTRFVKIDTRKCARNGSTNRVYTTLEHYKINALIFVKVQLNEVVEARSVVLTILLDIEVT